MNKRIYLILCFSTLLCGQNKAQSWVWNNYASESQAQKKMSLVKTNYLYLYPSHHYWQTTEGDTIFKINLGGQTLNYLVVPKGLSLVSLAIAPDSGLYLAGNFAGTVTIGSNTYLSSNMDIWLARYNKSYNLEWFKTIASKDQDLLNHICINGNGLVLTGSVSDTVNFLGQQIPKAPGESFFVAKVSDAGSLSVSKFAIGVASSSPSCCQPRSAGLECEVDRAGNIYVLTRASGESHVDTFVIGEWGSALPSFGTTSTKIVKFNSSLQPLHVTTLENCVTYCNNYRDLVVNSMEERFVIRDYSYHQSGNDKDWSTVLKINSTGSLTTSYRLRPDQNSHIATLRKDGCDNLYFTGFWRNAGSSNYLYAYYSFVTAQLSSSLTVNWMIQDSSRTNRTMGTALSVIENNYCFISGLFNDSLTLANPMTCAGQSGFFAKVVVPFMGDCESDVGIVAKDNLTDQPFAYPNPNKGLLYFSECSNGQEVSLYSIYGELVHRSAIEHQTMDIGSLPDGIYFVEVKNGAHQKMCKLILEK
jgi:hypothetical protein